MIRKETFVGILHTLKDYRKRTEEMCNDIEAVLRKHKPEQMDFIRDAGLIFEDWNLIDNTINALSLEFTYKNAVNDINWWFHEASEFDNLDDAWVEVDGEQIHTYTAQELYDYMMLMENKQNNQENN